MNPLWELLTNLQQPDGSFISISIPGNASVTTTYYTSLIMLCIAHTPDHPLKQVLIQKSLHYLKHHASALVTWNYISPRDVSSYPDDLDDTFLALLALSYHEPEFITPENLVAIVQTLVRNETQPGGPYFTWDVSPDQRPTWYSIDLVVNTTIYGFLKHHDIQLPALKSFINKTISEENYYSEFYDHHLIVWYFIARNFSKDLDDTARKVLTQSITSFIPLNPFEEIMLMITKNYVCPCDFDNCFEIETLLSKYELSESPKSFGFFIEKIENGKKIHSSCAALRPALLLELIGQQMHDKKYDHESESIDEKIIMAEILELFEEETHDTSYIQSGIKKEIMALSKHNTLHDIALLPYRFYENSTDDCKDAIDEQTIHHLCLATLLGWIGYGIQDDIMDMERNPQSIAVGTSCIIRAYELFTRYLHGSQDSLFVSDILHDMNEALLDESDFTCDISDSGTCIIPEKLPSLSYDPLPARKSLGYALGPIVITLVSGTKNNGSQARHIKTFFEYFLSMRQTLDDMHDWLHDLENGIITPVGGMILSDYKKVFPDRVCFDPTDDKDVLEEIFWNKTINDIIPIVHSYEINARKTLDAITVLDDYTFLTQRIDRYHRIFSKILSERDMALAFIDTYSRTPKM